MNRFLQRGVWCILFTGLRALGQHSGPGSAIPPSQAWTAIGTNAVVMGRVAEVKKTANEFRLYFAPAFTNPVFSAVVRSGNLSSFTNLEALLEKSVQVSGLVVGFQGRPEMNLSNSSQLQLLKPARPPAPGPLRVGRAN